MRVKALKLALGARWITPIRSLLSARYRSEPGPHKMDDPRAQPLPTSPSLSLAYERQASLNCDLRFHIIRFDIDVYSFPTWFDFLNQIVELAAKFRVPFAGTEFYIPS